jgi:plastocyanin
MRRLGRIVFVVAALTIVGTACSSDDPATETSSTPTTVAGSASPRGTAVTIENFSFSPPDLQAGVGEDITVTNKDGAVHTLTAEDKTFSTGNLDPAGSATVKPTRAGTFAYFCEIHQYMKGRLTIS